MNGHVKTYYAVKLVMEFRKGGRYEKFLNNKIYPSIGEAETALNQVQPFYTAAFDKVEFVELTKCTVIKTICK